MSDLADPVAEASVIACALHSTDAIDYAAARLDTTDFTDPLTSAAWTAIRTLRDRGSAVNHVTLAAQLGGEVDRQQLSRLQIAGPAAMPGLPDYVTALVKLTGARRVVETSMVATKRIHDGQDPADVSDWVTAELAAVDRASAARLPGTYSTVREFLHRPPSEEADELIPGLMRRDWRVVIVAPEGLGKSVLLRSLGGYAAYGLHPLDPARTITPIRSLIVDLENPDEALHGTFETLARTGDARGAVDDDRLRLWRQRDGINVRQRADLALLEAVIVDARPDLVCMGPAYKLFAARPGEDAEGVAGDVLARLDKLRTRHRFGLALETHAPHGSGAAARDLRPFGSSTWLRWPEIGIGMKPTGVPGPGYQDYVELQRWRGDRVVNEWPAAVRRGKHRLWEATAKQPAGASSPVSTGPAF